MIELKDVVLYDMAAHAVPTLSASVGSGEALIAYGSSAQMRHGLMTAIQGLTGVRQGYLTIDGEVVTPASGRYFRRSMAFVPAQPQLPYASLHDMLRGLYTLRANRPSRGGTGDLADVWHMAGIADDLAYGPIASLRAEQTRAAMICMAQWQRKPMVLVEEVTSAAEAALLRRLAAEGAAVIVTAPDGTLADQFDKHIDINNLP